MREIPVRHGSQILGENDTADVGDALRPREGAQALLSFDDMVWAGTGQVNRCKGHNYLTVFADLMAKCLFFATPGKEASL
jgi:hypothetical protein